jgi:hypothetical protein
MYLNKNNDNIANETNSTNNNPLEETKGNEEDEEEKDNWGICPITDCYMEHPVLAPSGQYYEKSAILNWLSKHETDPMTREHLTKDMLIEDEEYRLQIIEYKLKNNIK